MDVLRDRKIKKSGRLNLKPEYRPHDQLANAYQIYAYAWRSRGNCASIIALIIRRKVGNPIITAVRGQGHTGLKRLRINDKLPF
jgi:hypothetical protein